MENIKELIARELQETQCGTDADNGNVRAGIFTARRVNDMMQDAAKEKNPDNLFLNLWYEGELSCLFADSNLGKSILAVQIARDIASAGKKVLYFDLELSDKQFQMRYTNDSLDSMCLFPDTLMRVQLNRDCLKRQLSEVIIDDIESMIAASGSRHVIIDNLTWLSSASESGDEAATLMQRLMALKFRYNLSMLIIAHTPKRDLTRVITANDLAGSKKLFNFFDSVFAIGRSAADEQLRYIKQIKCRYGEFTYDTDNVLLCSIEKERDSGYIYFETQGTAPEREHLRAPNNSDRGARVRQVIELFHQGKPYSQIAKEVGISKATVGRIILSN